MNDRDSPKQNTAKEIKGGGGAAERTAGYWKSNPLAHVSDVVRREEEVLKSLVAHLKHTCVVRGGKEETRFS